MTTLDELKKVKDRNLKKLKQIKNVIGVGIGHKITNGKDTGELCLSVLVTKKMAFYELSNKDFVPKIIDNNPTDVKEVGEIVALKARTERWRPAPGGVSIGHYSITAGTLGGFVKDTATNETLILSNNHVMANSNNASIGDTILQPGPADGGKVPQDRIADLERYVSIQFKDTGDSDCSIANQISAFLNFLAKIVGSKHRMFAAKIELEYNEVDAAVAKPAWNDVITNDIIDIGVITGTRTAEINMPVRKSGRTSGTNTGEIKDVNVNIDVGYGGSIIATFENQIVATAISQPGDSGSLVIHGSEQNAVGLLFAGSDAATVINPIDRVLELLNVIF